MSYPQHYFETAQICLSGHVATLNYERNPGERTLYCPICGKNTIYNCPKCHAPIRGVHYMKELVTTSINVLTHESHQVIQEHQADTTKYSVPLYCHNCGEPYPWTKSTLDAAAELIDEEMCELNAEEKSKFKASLPDIIAQTPKTTLAAKRISKWLGKCAPTVQETFKQIFYRIAADVVRISLWGS